VLNILAFHLETESVYMNFKYQTYCVCLLSL